MNKKNIGNSFDEFLSENAILDEATAVAVKRVIAWQIEQEMKAQNLKMSSCWRLEIKSWCTHCLRSSLKPFLCVAYQLLTCRVGAVCPPYRVALGA